VFENVNVVNVFVSIFNYCIAFTRRRIVDHQQRYYMVVYIKDAPGPNTEKPTTLQLLTLHTLDHNMFQNREPHVAFIKHQKCR
jgi:hypothetical protein